MSVPNLPPGFGLEIEKYFEQQWKAWLRQRRHRAGWLGAMPPQRPRLLSVFEFLLNVLPTHRRDDTLMDISDWYPEWAAAHGRFSAHCLCAFKVIAAFGGLFLDVLERMATIVGKLRGAK